MVDRRTTSTRELVARRRRGCGYCGGIGLCDVCRAYEDGVLDGAEHVVKEFSRPLTCTCPEEPESCEAHAHLITKQPLHESGGSDG